MGVYAPRTVSNRVPARSSIEWATVGEVPSGATVTEPLTADAFEGQDALFIARVLIENGEGRGGTFKLHEISPELLRFAGGMKTVEDLEDSGDCDVT